MNKIIPDNFTWWEKDQEEKNLWWRPSKIKDFVEAFAKVLSSNELDIIILTDDELRISCNDLLDEWQQISDTTFKNRKSWALKDSEEYQRFLALYKKALINQKRALFTSVNLWLNNWQSRAWIIERKFSEWNLKQIKEVTGKDWIPLLPVMNSLQMKNIANEMLQDLE
jgi:hypothetical protein